MGSESRNYFRSVDVQLPEIIDGRVRSSIYIEGGLQYYTGTAYDDKGLESDFSNEVSYSWMPVPKVQIIFIK